ncbi:hypothetical protein EES43_27670 [Streptomyces sp. ADI96-02]|nr:hypothetical protein EES43_27670 [Streptomyces sp. ADI96-02]
MEGHDREIRHDILAGVNQRRPPSVVIDLRRLHHADHHLLQFLLEIQRAQTSAGRVLFISGPLQPVIGRLFDLTGALVYFTFTATPPLPQRGCEKCVHPGRRIPRGRHRTPPCDAPRDAPHAGPSGTTDSL